MFVSWKFQYSQRGGCASTSNASSGASDQ